MILDDNYNLNYDLEFTIRTTFIFKISKFIDPNFCISKQSTWLDALKIPHINYCIVDFLILILFAYWVDLIVELHQICKSKRSKIFEYNFNMEVKFVFNSKLPLLFLNFVLAMFLIICCRFYKIIKVDRDICRKWS